MSGARTSEADEAESLLSAAAVRERCGVVLAAAERGETPHFRVAPERLAAAAERVVAVMRRRYPDLNVPYHSRWRHFGVGGIDRAALIAPGADWGADWLERARARIDLAIVSVLLDAGAGPVWRYREAETGAVLARSEGLAVASLRAMQQGLFSSNPDNPWRADAAALRGLTADRLAGAFQHGPGNELAGVEGRAALLRRLGEVAGDAPQWFGRPARLGNLVDFWARSTAVPDAFGRRDARGPGEVAAPAILRLLLHAFGAIWSGRLSLGGVPLGDCGRHSNVPGDGLVPFHKLSQWLTYSLVEPLEDAGMRVTDLDGLTGLAEYRNGGLFFDTGCLVPRDPELPKQNLDPFAEPVVEWRALTAALLDRLAAEVRGRLGKNAAELPLAAVLEGGTWAAGREIAAELRPDGRPPLTVASDGTLF